MTRVTFYLIPLLFACTLLQAQVVPAPTATGLKIGDTAPAIEAKDHAGKTVNLQALLKKGPVILTFYRGVWCPFCNKYAAALQDSMSRFDKKQATLIAITPETTENAQKMAEKNKLTYSIISDENHKLMDAYGVTFTLSEDVIKRMNGYGIDMAKHNGTNGPTLPVPATVVIGRDGKIKFLHFNPDYKVRAPIAEVMDKLD